MNSFRHFATVTLVMTLLSPAYPGEIIQYTNGNEVNVVVLEGDYIWSGTNGGLIRWKRNTEEYRKFTTLDGLTSNIINDIAIDHEGVKWIATPNGITRYDGVNWQSISADDGLPDYTVYAIAIARNGDKLIGTAKGFCIFDGSGWTLYDSTNGLRGNSIVDVAEDNDGNIWLATLRWGISKFDGTNWTNFTETNSGLGNWVRCIAMDKENSMWFGTYNGVRRFKSGNWMTLTSEDGLISDLIESIAFDSHGGWWFGGSRGVTYFKGGNHYWFDGNNSPIGSLVNSITIDEDDNACIGDGKSGIVELHRSDWQYYFIPGEVLPTNAVYDIVSEGAGAGWIGTSRGAYPFNGEALTSYDYANRISPYITYAIEIDGRGQRWFGQFLGKISSFDGLNWRSYNQPEEGPDNRVSAIRKDKEGKLWFCTNRGILMHDGANWYSYLSGYRETDSYVRDVAIDSHNNKWVATDNGVLSFDGNSWTRYRAEDGLISNLATSVSVDQKDNIWFGTSYGISKFDGISWISYDTSTGLNDNYITASETDPMTGFVWFGSINGINIFDGNAWQSFMPHNGLSDRQVNSISFNQQGDAWIGTSGGITIVPAGTVTGIETVHHTPSGFNLAQNYPNPFNSTTKISYSISHTSEVRLTIYNILGQEVRVLVRKYLAEGSYEEHWDGKDNLGRLVSSGVYLYRMSTDSGYMATKKMVLIQ